MRSEDDVRSTRADGCGRIRVTRVERDGAKKKKTGEKNPNKKHVHSTAFLSHGGHCHPRRNGMYELIRRRVHHRNEVIVYTVDVRACVGHDDLKTVLLKKKKKLEKLKNSSV